jgi:hypothetical protein
MRNVILMGPQIDHRASLEAMLADRVNTVAWIPDSVSLMKGRAQGFQDRIRRAVDQLTYTRNPAFIEAACRTIDETGADTVVAYWGTIPLPDIASIKRLRPHVRVAAMVLCHPLSLTHMGVWRQNGMMRRAAKWVDAFLFPDPQMADYFEQAVLGRGAKRPASFVLWPCWPARYQATERAQPASERPNVIFAGRTDLSHHTVHAADDLRPLMREILDAGIALHHVRSTETTDGHPLRHPFDPLTQQQLIARMPLHDASLIAYNTEACQRAERFDLTVPDRLITSVAAGVPVAIPRQGYAGSKAYLARYPAVFQFDSGADLMRQLEDRGRVKEARDAAWEARARYTAEMQGEGLVRFMATLG